MKNEPKKIEVVSYDSNWPKQFEDESSKIKDILGDNFLAIHHVGSTSVPGLSAKPKIDIIAVVKDPERSIKQLEALGYDYRGEYNIPFHYGFSKRGSINVNLHVYKNNHPEIELNLAFRDYLRAHPNVRDEYAALKLELLEKSDFFDKNNSMFSGYNLGKNSFITRVLRKIGFDRLRFVICTHFAEWDAAKHFRQKYFFDKVPINDPFEWTFNHKDHIHFVLYKGWEIIGYAHIQLWPDSRAVIRIIVVNDKERNQGFGGKLLSWIEEWLKTKGYGSIHAESSPEALRFYRNQGYIKMSFNDPDGYEGDKRDIPVGKILKI